MIVTALLLSLSSQLPQQHEITPPMSFVDNPTTPTQAKVNLAIIAGARACHEVTKVQYGVCLEIVAAFIGPTGSADFQAARDACVTGQERAADDCWERNGFEIPSEVFQQRMAVARIQTEFTLCGEAAKRTALACLERGESRDNCSKTAMIAIDACGVVQRAKITALDFPTTPLRAKRRPK